MAQGNPKGNPQNLKSFGTTKDKEKEKEIHAKGGKASGKAKRERKAMREQLEMILKLPIENEKLKSQIEKLGVNTDEIDNQMALTISIFQEAMRGNTRAYEIIRDTIGEKPIDKQEIKEITTEWFK